ncbi:MAG: hypothetical protein O3A51_11715, partial [Verrucomicrobia bacterium]|nr:hypothetical protein [Verrucomicrobiota bacterium]
MTLVLLSSGCASSRRDVVLSDLMRSLQSPQRDMGMGPEEELDSMPEDPMDLALDSEYPDALPGPDVMES